MQLNTNPLHGGVRYHKVPFLYTNFFSIQRKDVQNVITGDSNRVILPGPYNDIQVSSITGAVIQNAIIQSGNVKNQEQFRVIPFQN